jgi:putative sigma-54 modulation protein
MDLVVNSHNMELSPELKGYIERKLGRFNQKLPNIMEIKVDVYEEMTRSAQDRAIVKVSINGANTVMHSQERAETILTAVDKAAEAITKQIDHQKGKLQDKGKAGPSIRTTSEEPEPLTPAAPHIIRARSMEVKPMSLEEALDQVKILNYEYLLFENTDTKRVNLLHRRADGNFILVQPEG